MSGQLTEGLLEPFGYGLAYPDWSDETSPAAGATLTHTVGGKHSERVLAAIATLTTDANVANRLVSVDFINQRGTTYVRNAASVLVTASTTNQVFNWSINRSVAEWNTGTPVFVPLLDVIMPPGFTIKFSVDNIQAGDQLSAIHLWLEKFPTGPRGYPQGAQRVAVVPAG